MDFPSFGDGLLQGFSFVESVRNARAAREMQAREMALREEANRRANEAAAREAEQHKMIMQQANDKRLQDLMTRSAAAYRALIDKYGSPDAIPDDAKAPLLDIARKYSFGEDNTTIDRIHRAKDNTAVLEISGTRPDGTKFSGKPMTVNGGTNDRPIVLAPGDDDNIMLRAFSQFDPALGAYFDEQRTRADIRTALAMSNQGASATTPVGAPAGSQPPAQQPPTPAVQPPAQQPVSRQAPAPAPAAQPPVRQAPAPAKSLQEQQAEIDAQGGFAPIVNAVKRVANAVTDAGDKAITKLVNDRWAAVVDIKRQGVTTADTRRNPAKYADEYLTSRSRLDPSVRAKLDEHFRPVLEARADDLRKQTDDLRKQLDDLRAKKFAINDVIGIGNRAYDVKMVQNQLVKTQSRLADLQEQLDDFASKMSVTAQADIKGSQKVGEPLAEKITPALQRAAEQPPAGRPTPTKMMADKQLVLNMRGKKRVTDAQIDALARLVSQKLLTFQQADRLIKTGELEAPTFVDHDPRKALIKFTPDGRASVLYAPDPTYMTAAERNAATRAVQALDKQNRSFIHQLATDEEQKRGKAAKGTASEYEAGFIQWMSSSAKELHDTFGYDVWDPATQRVNTAALDYDAIGLMWKGYMGALDARRAEEGHGAMYRLGRALIGGKANVPGPIDKMIEAGARPAPSSAIASKLTWYRQRAQELGRDDVANMSDEELAQALQEDGRL